MVYARKIRVGLLLLVSLVAACAGPQINAPGPGVQALLVIPVELEARVVRPVFGFYYVYEINRSEDESFKHEIEIRFPVAEDLLIVDTLPPGDYFVRRLYVRPLGSGDKKIARSSIHRYDPFTLKAGKITIFSKTLKLSMRNQDPGRFGTVLSRIDMIPLSSSRKNEVLATLNGLPNIETWEISTGD